MLPNVGGSIMGERPVKYISRYDVLKGRIKELDNGWDLKADEIFDEIAEEINGECNIHIKPGIVKFSIFDCNGLGMGSHIHTYTTRCEKFGALKKGLLWLLTRSDLKEKEKLSDKQEKEMAMPAYGG